MHELAPDIETSSEAYASRFAGAAGAYLLSRQKDCVRRALAAYSGCSLLDVGGGHGQLVQLYDELNINYTIHGSHERCFQYSLRELSPERKVVSGLRQLPFTDAAFDVVIAVRLVAHLDDWPLVLAEMCRVARHAVIIDFPARRSFNALTPILFSVKKDIEKNTRTYQTFSRKDFDSALQAIDFKVDIQVNQFFIPMVVHRLMRGNLLATAVEATCRMLGLTWALGSPAILRAVRTEKTVQDT